MEALKVKRISASDEAELSTKNVQIRERRNGYLHVVAIGGG